MPDPNVLSKGDGLTGMAMPLSAAEMAYQAIQSSSADTDQSSSASEKQTNKASPARLIRSIDWARSHYE